jgi:hypothetical protein
MGRALGAVSGDVGYARGGGGSGDRSTGEGARACQRSWTAVPMAGGA